MTMNLQTGRDFEDEEQDEYLPGGPQPEGQLQGKGRVPLEDSSLQGLVDARPALADDTSSIGGGDDGDDDLEAEAAADAGSGSLLPTSESIPIRLPMPGPGSFNPSILEAIQKRQGTSGSDLLHDPLMKDYEQKQKSLDELKAAKMGADKIANLSQSFGQFARGSLPPSANAGEQVASNLGKQGQESLKEGEEDLNRRQRILNSIEARKGRESIESGKAQDRMLLKNLSEKARYDKQIDSWSKELKQDLDPNGARAGNMGFNQRKADQGERIQNLIHDANGDLRNLDPRQMEELAIGINTLLSSSSVGAASQIAALVPKSAMGNVQKLKEWLLNDPQGTNQQKFVQRMSETVDRERNLALDQVRRAQTQRLARHETFKKFAPEQYNAEVNAYMGSGPSSQQSSPQFLDPSKVKVGDVIDGYKYTGGNPNDEASWQQAE